MTESTYRIGDATVTRGSAWVVTSYDDGAELHAHPDPNDDQQPHIAKALGYGDGPDALARCTRDHDVIHSLVADARGWPHSRTLRGVALGKYAPREVSDDEERIVMLIQRLLQVGLDGVLQDYADAVVTQ